VLLGPSLAVSAILFSLGVVGVLLRRNAIIIFMCIELMLNAVNLAFVALSQQLGIDGQVFVIAVYRHRETVNLQNINLLRG